MVCQKIKDDEVYVCGNPPFLGSVGRDADQNADMEMVFKDFSKFKTLDIVASWFWKGAKFIANSNSEMALVSTNSICQGDQVCVLWKPIFELGLFIHFAYESFSWKNNAKDNAAVHVVIVGLSNKNINPQIVRFIDKEWHYVKAKIISPYILDGGRIAVESRGSPLGKIAPMVYGNKPLDGGNLLLTRAERDALVQAEPSSAKWIKKVLGADEFINGVERYCLWLVGSSKEVIESMPEVEKRVNNVRMMRLKSVDSGARRLAENAHTFRDTNNPDKWILVPSVSSERRQYVPLGFFDSSCISTNANLMIPNGGLYEFGVMNSTLHLDWLRTVGGRLKSDYRYSATLVYNTFPWPTVNTVQRDEIEKLAENVVLIREDYLDKTMAQLYDPDLMPAPLLAAHQSLDAAVENLYRDKPFKDLSERLEHLFARYEKLVAAENNKKLK